MARAPKSKIEVFDFEQNSEEWKRIRCGLATASMFHAVLAKGDGKTRDKYMKHLAAEIITGEPIDTFQSADMRRGLEQEPEACAFYEFMAGVETTKVGFIRNGSKGCSPDRLVGKNGILQTKSMRPDLLIDVLFRGPNDYPPEHLPQCQGEIMVAEREWCDLQFYWPKMPWCVRRITRNERYIQNLEAEINRFNDELSYLVDKLRVMQGA
jgi:YqaJ-like viral recombinase domain